MSSVVLRDRETQITVRQLRIQERWVKKKIGSVKRETESDVQNPSSD